MEGSLSENPSKTQEELNAQGTAMGVENVLRIVRFVVTYHTLQLCVILMQWNEKNLRARVRTYRRCRCKVSIYLWVRRTN